MSDSPFQQLRGANQLLEVGMDDLQLFLPNSGKCAIGTQGLNGCTCVVIIGDGAILMAHLSPVPGRYDQCVTITTVVKQNPDRFPTTTTAWGIFANSSDGSMHWVIRQVQHCLDSMGFGMRPAFYKEVLMSRTTPRPPPPKGEVVAFFLRGNPELWLERSKIWPEDQHTTTASATSHLRLSLASSSATVRAPSATSTAISTPPFAFASTSSAATSSAATSSAASSSGSSAVVALKANLKKLENNYTVEWRNEGDKVIGALKYKGAIYKIQLSGAERKIAFPASDTLWNFSFVGDDDIAFAFKDGEGLKKMVLD